MKFGAPQLAALLLTAWAAEAFSEPASPIDPATVRARFLAGDLVSVARARALRAARGEDVDRGTFGLLDDLSRLVRCLPLGPVPEGEAPEHRAARRLVRVERIRLERVIRDGVLTKTPLAALLGGALFQARPADQSAELVRWPMSRGSDGREERWAGEAPDPTLEPSKCPSLPGALRETPDERARARAKLRAEAEAALVESLVEDLVHFPGEAAAALAVSFLASAPAVDPPLPPARAAALEAALTRGREPERSAGRYLLARRLEAAGDDHGARRLYHLLLDDGGAGPSERLAARVRLVALLEPDWTAVLEVARGPRLPGSVEEAALINAEARALFAVGDWEGLMRLGRVFVQRGPVPAKPGPPDSGRSAPCAPPACSEQRGPEDFDRDTAELLLALGLELEPARALAWVEELSAPEPGRRTERLETLAQLALSRGREDLSAAAYDRLRLEAARARSARGPRAAAEEAHWLAARARVELEREDVAAFAFLMDELTALAKNEEARPLARHAPHRELAKLSQDYLGRLSEDLEQHPERRKLAALLLEATTALAQSPSRYRSVLLGFEPPLRILAGQHAPSPSGAPASAPVRRPGQRGHAKPVRLLGEVTIPRLPPRLSPPDPAPPLPERSTLLVYEAADGTWVSGVPWAARVKSASK